MRLCKLEIAFRMLSDKQGVRGMAPLEEDPDHFVLENSRLV